MSNYSEDDIKAIAKIFGMDCTDKDSLVRLCERMEGAAFWFSLALEDKILEPQMPASKAAQKVASPAKMLEDAVNYIRNYPRMIDGDLRRVANEFGDKTGEKFGAKRFLEIIDSLQWAIACLKELEKEYQESISISGGNRPDKARLCFYDSLLEIITEFSANPIKSSTDRVSGEVQGPLFEFIKICFGPFKINTDPSSIAKAFERHIQGANVPGSEQ